MTHDILSKVFAAKTVAIFIHINPDEDAVGSAIAMQHVLSHRGIIAHCFSEQAIPDSLLAVDVVDSFNSQQLPEYDLALIVDAAEIARIGNNCIQILKKCSKVALIDHHEQASSAGIDYEYRDATAASATQVIYYLLKDYDPALIDRQVAEAIYAGALTDSGGFQFSSVTSRTMQMVAELYAYDIDATTIARKLMHDVKRSVFELHSQALSQARFFDNGSIGVVVLTTSMFERTGTTPQDTMNIVTKINDVSEVQIAISLSQIAPNAYKVSTRSKGTGYALSLAKCFGGGGHREASGCRIYGYLEDCIEKLVSAARDVMSDD